MDQFLHTSPIETPVFTYYPPIGTVRGFISIPHAGLVLPDEFKPFLVPTLAPHELNCDVDYQLDKLLNITALQNAGVAVLVAKVHRVCVDLNQTPETAILSHKENSQGVTLLASRPDDNTISELIETYHQSYYDFMITVVHNITSIKLGFVSLLALQSISSQQTALRATNHPEQLTSKLPIGFCIGNMKGLSCQRVYTDSFKDAFENADYAVLTNTQVTDGYSITSMDEQLKGNVVECEINRGIYMDEGEVRLIDDKVKELRDVLTPIIINIYTAFNTPFKINQEIEAEGGEKDEIDSQFAFGF